MRRGLRVSGGVLEKQMVSPDSAGELDAPEGRGRTKNHLDGARLT